MTHNENDEGMDQANAARERAAKMLAEVEAQRPEVREVAERARILRRQNSFALLVTQAMQRVTS